MKKYGEKPFKGSDYDEEYTSEGASIFAFIVIVLMFFGLPIGLVFWIRRIKRKSAEKRLKKFSERFGYFREIPNEGKLNATYALGRVFNICEDGAILATGMLHLMQIGCLSPIETQKVGFMGRTKETVSLKLMGSQHNNMNEYDEYLYTVLESAVGSDAIL